VIARDYKERNTVCSKLIQSSVHEADDLLGHTAPEEEIPAVDECVGFCPDGVSQNAMEIVEEILTSSAYLQPGMNRKVKTEVSIGTEDNSYRFLRHRQCTPNKKHAVNTKQDTDARV
jgi:hypothetical protein